MRFLFWLLLLANVGVLAYFNQDKLYPQPAVNKQPVDIQASKLQLLNDKDLEAMPKRMTLTKTRALPNSPTACYTWGSFRKQQLEAVQTILDAMNVNYSAFQDSSQSIRHWVYKPPVASYELALAKGEELKKLGINDFFIVKSSELANAISFGVFKNEDLALKLMEDLRKQGVRKVVKSVRNQGDSTITLNLIDVTAPIREQIKKNQPDYPLTNIKKADCPV